MLKKIPKPVKAAWRSAALAFLWSNRRDVARWVSFSKRIAFPKSRPNLEDIKLEARVRASLTMDPLLRSDPSLRDLRVHDGIVVLGTPVDWHNKSLAISRIKQVKGVESVHTASDVNEQNFLDVELIDIPVAPASV